MEGLMRQCCAAAGRLQAAGNAALLLMDGKDASGLRQKWAMLK